MPWLSTEVKRCFSNYFLEAEKKITKFVNEYDEERLTGKLIDNYFSDVENLNLDIYKRLKECVKRFMNLNLRIWATTTSRRSESVTGADFGIILEVNYSELKCKKAILMQAKKWPQKPRSNDYERIQKQAKRMINTTSSGYFIFYQDKRVIVVDVGQILGRDKITEDVIKETGKRFYKFMTDYFLETFVGDYSESSINIALGKHLEIPVKHSINISLTREQ